MIGTHTVTAYSDRNAAGWGAPIFTNAYFDTDLAGWIPSPFAPVWTHTGAGTVTSTNANTGDGGDGVGLDRSEAACIVRPANVATYRVRSTVTVPVRSLLFIYLNFGKNRTGASRGSFWSPGNAISQWGAVVLQAGTTTVEWLYTQNVPPGPEYGFLGVTLNVYPEPETPGLSYTASVSSIVVDYRSTGGSADLSCLVDEVAIVHGRDSADGQPTASSATIDFTVTPEAPLPALVDIGAVVLVNTTTPDGTYARFAGRVTDITLAWDDAGEDTPNAGVGQIVCVGMLADLARRVVGDTPWPQELDGARIGRIADLAGEPIDPRSLDPGVVQILARDVDSKAALEVMTGVAESAGGMVWQTRGGELRYADAEHRRGTAPSLLLDACDVLVTPRWVRNLEGLVNQVSIGYGVPPDGGDQPRYVASSPDSVTRYGRYQYELTTELAALADAQAMGQLVLVRNAAPVWILSALPVDLDGMSAEESAQALGLEMHALIQVTGFPAIGSAPTIANLWVEGWRERLAHGVHEIELYVTGYCRTSPPPRWNDLDPSWLWDTVAATLTWDATTCLGPTLPTNTWDGVPASLRWDDVAPSVLWDTYLPALVEG